MNFQEYFRIKSSEFPDFNSFKKHVEEIINSRDERLVDRIGNTFSGEAAVLFSLVYPSSESISLCDIYTVLEKRSNILRHNPGDMAFPGGKADPEDESLIHTAIREAEEEIGVDAKLVKPIGFLDEFVSSSRRVVRVVVAWIQEDHPKKSFHEFLKNKYRPLTKESEAVVAIPLSHLLNPENYSSTPYPLQSPNSGKKGYIRYFDISPYLPNTQIWGLTASIIRRFVDVIFPDNLFPYEK